jgi:NDP-sugar pyrophosphorylase family protein
MNMKYELVKEEGTHLFRIKALKDIDNMFMPAIKKGDLGGLVEGYYNLSKKGNCWIDYTSQAIEYGQVKGGTAIQGYSYIQGSSKVFGDSNISNRCLIHENAQMMSSQIQDTVTVEGSSVLFNCKIRKCNTIKDKELRFVRIIENIIY